MALQYFLYDTTYGNTIVDRSDISFAPSPPFEEIHIDYFIPETQPLYLYANSGGTGGTIIVNSQVNIDNYLNATELPPTPDGNVTYGEFTGSTTALSATTAALETNKVNVSGDTMSGSLFFGTETTPTTLYGRIGKNIGYTGLDIQGLAGVSIDTPYWVNPQWSGFTGSYLTLGTNGLITLTTPPTGATSWQVTGGSNNIVANVPEDLGFIVTPTQNVTAGTIEWNIDFTNSENQSASVSLQGILDNVVYPTLVNYTVAKNETSKLFGSVPVSTTIPSGSTLDIRIISDRNGVVNRSLLRLSQSGSGSGLVPSLQQVTSVGAQTNIETIFNSGIKTNQIRPSGDTVTAIQVRKADGTTVIINVDSVSGLTGFNEVNPQGVVHAYGTDASNENPLGTQKNAVIIDGPSNVDTDIQWAENGIPKWLAETYRNELSKFWYLYNVESQNSPLTVMETGRIGINKNTNLMDDDAAQIVGTGLSDLTISGEYTENYNAVYRIEMASTGTPDQWKWKKSIDGGVIYGSYSPLSACTTGATLIEYGIYVSFASPTGHTIGNIWEFGAFTQIPQATLSLAPMGFSEVQLTNDYTAPTIIYKDLTALANGGFYDSKFTVFNTGTGGTIQAFYWGTTVQINSIFFNLHQIGASITLVVEYWNGTSWIAMNFNDYGLIDATENLTKSGRIIWTPNHMVGWIKTNIPDLIDVESQLYWIRIRTSTNPTISPKVHTISVGNDRRLSIYNSYNDYRPSVFVDSFGRMNIGGGNITGSNRFQVNSSAGLSVDSVAGGDSYVEFDSEDSCLSTLRLKVASNDTLGTSLEFGRTRGTLDTPLSMQTNDLIGRINFKGRVGTSGSISSQIASQYVGNGSTTRCADLIFSTACGSCTANAIERVRIDYKGNTGFGTSPTALVTLGSGTTTNAPLKFTSGSLLSTPQAGAMEFLGDKTYITTTGGTRQTFAYLDSPVFTGNPSMPSGTTFAQGLKTNKIIPIGNCASGLQITKANGVTSIINVDTTSGFTGYGTINPKSLVHLYGTDNNIGDGWNYQTNSLRLDGGFDSDKDVQWYNEGQPKFTAQIYRCENGRFWYLSSPQGHINQLTVSEAGRVGINNQTNIMAYHAAVLLGGPNDMSVSGIYTQNYTSVYDIEINTITGATDTFRWRASTDEGNTFSSWSASIDLNYSPYELEYGVNVYWDNLTGHTLGTTWTFGAFAQLPIGTFVVTPNRFVEVQQTLNYTASAITYTDITAEANSSTYGSLITIFNTGVTNNAVYFGTLDKLNSIFANLDIHAVGVTLIAEYWNGLAWINITTNNHAYVDGTSNLTKSGNITWETSSMTGWIPAYIPNKVEDGYLLYWIRLRTSTNATIAPIANSFARNGNYRFAVLTSPSDFKPSFYVDSLGRTNIGGGNMTGSNLLQINSVSNLPVTAGGRDSLAEIDSQDSSATDLKIKLASNDACDTGLILVNTRGTLLNPLNNQTGDYLGHIEFRGRFNNSGQLFAKIQSQFTGNITDRDADLIFSTADNGVLNEVVRISSTGTTGFGVSTPTAIVHLKAGSTTIAPLKFNSGALLSTPQAGAMEFLGNAAYITTTGSTRKTFAFLESPVFTGAPELPVNSTLVGINLCNFIWYSGGTGNACLTSKSDFNAYTASTTTAISKAISGATNGICKYDCHNICLGGILTSALVLCGNQDICLQGKRIDIASSCGTQIYDKNGCGIEFYSSGGTTTIKGMSSAGAEKIRLQLSDTQALFTDSRAIPKGIEYNADYSSTFTSRSLVDKQYVDSQSSGLSPKSAVLVATTTNIGLSSAPSTIDGIIPSNGSRILVKNQTGATENGIYVYNGSGATMTRATDYASGSTQYNAYMAVISGSTNKNTSWILSAANPITVGTNASNFVLFSSQSGVAQGNGICVTQSSGNYNVAVKLANNCGLCSDASGLYVNSAIAGTGLQYSSGVINLNGSGLAGNSICWSGNSFNVDINSGSLSTALNSKLNISAFNSYSASTLTNINNRLLTSIYSNYTGTTAPAAYASKSVFNTYTGTTAPNTYYTKSQINSYTGATNTAIGLKANTASPTFTGTVRSVTPAVNDNSTCIATTAWYIGQCATTNPLMDGVVAVGTSTLWAKQDHRHPSDTGKTSITLFNTYTGTTAPNRYLDKTIYQTYTGTTAPNTYLSKTAFNTYSGTTVPNTYYTKSQINSYTGKTNTTLNAKAFLSGATFTGVVNVPKPAQNDNTSCAASTSWYISQAGTASPLMNGSVAVGTSNLFSRQDHVHPRDTSKLSLSGGTMTGTLNGTIINSSISICSPIITGSTKVCSPTIISTSSLCANGTTKLVGATTGSTLYLTTTPPAGSITQPTLFWDATTKQIESKTLTGGSDQYFYGESTTKTTASGTCVKAQGLSATTLAGRYQIEFVGQYGNASANACTFLALKINNTTQGTNYLGRDNVAAWQNSFSLSRDVTLAAQLNCFDIWYWNSGGTACVPFSIIRVKRIC